jgi:hypothetical protein
MNITATYTDTAGGKSTRLAGDVVILATVTPENVQRRLSDLTQACKLLPVKLTVES